MPIEPNAQTADIRDSFANTGCRAWKKLLLGTGRAAILQGTVQDRRVASRIRGLPGGATIPTKSEISSGA